MAYLTQITAPCQTSHFLLDMQAAPWDKQTLTDTHTKAAVASTQTWRSFSFQTPEKQMKLFLFLSQKREVNGGRNPIRSHNYMKLQKDLSVWRTEATLLRGAKEGEKVSPEDIKSLWTACVYACVREWGEALCCGAWTGTKADSLQMEGREIKKGKEGER